MDEKPKNKTEKGLGSNIPTANNKKLPLWLRWLVLIGLIVLVILILFFLMKPLRTYSAQKYVNEGDIFLANKQYLHADLAYEKALVLFPGNKIAKDRRALTLESSKNIRVLEKFYETEGFNNQGNKLKEATTFPNNETEAVKLSRKLLEDGEYQLAIIPAKTAVEMDNSYRDAWLYLGIANLKTAELVDLSSEARASYIEKSKEALNKAKEIDPESKDVKDYLSELQTAS